MTLNDWRIRRRDGCKTFSRVIRRSGASEDLALTRLVLKLLKQLMSRMLAMPWIDRVSNKDFQKRLMKSETVSSPCAVPIR